MSKVFTFVAAVSGKYKIILVSTTENYHPQMRMCEINRSGGGEKYVEMNADKANGMYGSSYDCTAGKEYLVEVGTSSKVNSEPFSNINEGGFVCSVSADKKSLQECLAQEEYGVSIFGKVGRLPVDNNKELNLGGSGASAGATEVGSKEYTSGTGGMSCGSLDYGVTPYLNEANGACTLYYHSGSFTSSSSSSTNSRWAASAVTFQCSSSGMREGSVSMPAIGRRDLKSIFQFTVYSRSCCDLDDLLLG